MAAPHRSAPGRDSAITSMPWANTSGKSGRLGEVDIDMDRIVVARCAAIQRERDGG